MVQQEVAIVVPTHSVDFHYTANLIDSHAKYQIKAPLHLVFSSNDELCRFEREYPGQYAYLAPHYHVYPRQIFNDPTWYKKWWGVNKIIDDYEYFLLMDTEFEFVKHVDVYEIVKDEFSKRRFFGHVTDVCAPRGVGQNATFCFDFQEKMHIQNITKGFQLYTYWNTLPIVERETAKQFIARYNVPNTPHSCTHETFPYHYFLLLYHGWTITDLTHIPNSVYPFGILECGGTNQEMLAIMKPYFTYWLAYKLEPEKFKDCNIFMTIHHDRQNGWYGPPGPPVKFYTAPSSEKDYHVVVTRFMEDVSWTREIDQKRLFIYDKSPEPLTNAIPVPNIGHEGETMLRHIIHHYDDLPDYTIFLQGNPFDTMRTKKTNMSEIILRHIETLPECEPFDTHWHLEDPFLYRSILVPEICERIFTVPVTALKFSAGAQYIISRRAIKCRPIEFYKKLHELFILQGHQKFLGATATVEPPCDPSLMNAWAFERIIPFVFDSRYLNK